MPFHAWILSTSWSRAAFTDLSHLPSCSLGEGVLWCSSLRVRLLKRGQRCFESYCRKWVARAPCDCWEDCCGPSLWRAGGFSWSFITWSERENRRQGWCTCLLMSFSSKDALAWIYFMFCRQPPGFLLAASFWVKERSSKQSGGLQKGLLSKKVLGEPLCWGKWAAAEQRLEPWNQKRTMAGLFWNGLFTAFLSNTFAHCGEVAMECSIKNSISGVIVPLWGWLELAGVSRLLEDVQKPQTSDVL